MFRERFPRHNRLVVNNYIPELCSELLARFCESNQAVMTGELIKPEAREVLQRKFKRHKQAAKHIELLLLP